MDVVIVNWVDITKKTSDDSFDEKIKVDDRITKMETVGWLYKESDKALLLVQEFDKDDDKPHDWIVIPKVLIEKIIPVSKS
jgi:hypothetical protein